MDLAADHYALDTSRAHDLGREPKHRIVDGLATLVAALKRDPLGWYRNNGITPPVWLRSAEERMDDPEALRAEREATCRKEHRASLWAHWTNAGPGVWLICSPPLLGYGDPWLILSSSHQARRRWSSAFCHCRGDYPRRGSRRRPSGCG